MSLSLKIVYCQDRDIRKGSPNTEFDFLGYTSRKVWIKDRLCRLQMNFLASVNKKAEQALKDRVKVSLRNTQKNREQDYNYSRDTEPRPAGVDELFWQI